MSNQPSEASSHLLLYSMALVGFLLIIHFGFFPHWINQHGHWMFFWPCSAPRDINHWESWELGALSWSLLFGFYYYFTFPFTGKNGSDRLLAGMLPLFTFGLCAFAVGCLLAGFSLLHFLAVLAIGIFFGLVDLYLWWKHTVENHKKSSLESLCVADAPMVIALLFLLIFRWQHSHLDVPGTQHGKEMEAFLGGAISFQLIVSNIIFVVIQLGLFRKIWA